MKCQQVVSENNTAGAFEDALDHGIYIYIYIYKGESIYIYKGEILSVCLSVCPSVCHAVNLPGTVDIAISTAKHQKPIILLRQVCHRE